MSFGQNFDIIFKHLDLDNDSKVETLDEFRGNLFGDIMAQFGLVDRPYEELLEKDKMIKAANEALDRYNDMAETQMNLVLFNFAVEHLLRISRVLKQPGGHALLVGVGGSGRQSLTRLASATGDFEIFQIEIKKNYSTNEFREDLKTLMRNVGVKGERTTFIFNDNSIKEESFLEDVNNILNTGEVPNIFPPDEKAEVCDNVRKPAKEENRCPEGTLQQLFSYFIERCKENLHIVMCFSPIGEALRNRIRNFPSLVNCTTIDWFSEWPKDALESVAQRFLSEIDLTDDVRQSCVQMVQTFHTTTQEARERFLREQRRYYYVTPTSYLELIQSFKRLLAMKRKEVQELRDKYANGYDCLIRTEESVGKMEEELIEMKPQLIEKSKEVDAQAEIVEKETVEAEKVREVVDAEASVAQEAADKTNAIKMDCEKNLEEAMPALRSAAKALENIGKNDITDLKTIKVFNDDVRMVLSAVCILMGVKPESKMNNET